MAEVAPGVRLLTGGVVNFYLVEEGGRFAVVDAGAPKDWALLVRALERLGTGLEAVATILLTHAHSDHTGFAERARTEGGATVRVHEADAETARTGKVPRNDGRMTAYLLKGRFYRTAFSLLRRGAGRIVPIHEVATFADGETLDVPGRPRAIHAPGHTAGACALFLEERSALVTGDVVVTTNPLTGRAGPQIMPSGFNRDTGMALESLGRIEEIAADVLLPGHGEPWREGPREAVRRAREAGPS
ncbi:MAG: MBL fold metallo-hydrolase [Actinobacteria bacterium]|nr:MBL fold metallo-hydrolase [Actinomycetota bacterium]